MSQHRLLPTALAAMITTGLIGMPQPAQANEPIPQTEPVVAQAAATASAYEGSLSVIGTSQINAPADRAIIVLSYYSNSYYSADSDPNAAAQTPQVLPSDIKNVVDALVTAGVPASNIKAFPDYTTPGSMKVRLMLDQPTQARVEQTIEAANTAVMKTNRYTTSGAVVGYTVNDCQSVENQARQAAMNDAQNRANALARVAGAQVGRVHSLSESVSWGTSYSTVCPASSDPTAYTDYYSLPMYDPSVPPTVRVVYSLNATYEMK
jgi:uncharacterized protein YggE